MNSTIYNKKNINILKNFYKYSFHIKSPTSEMNTVYYDIDLDDVIDVPACNYDDLLNSYLVEENILIPQARIKIKYEYIFYSLIFSQNKNIHLKQ